MHNISFLLLESILEESCFDQLRNKEQLGYSVGVSKRLTRGIPGILFSVESAEYHPIHIQERIFLFITEFYEKLLKDENLYK